MSRPGLLVALLACSALSPAVQAAQELPRRVASLNLCSDQLAMALLPASRIVSVTWLSRTEGDPALRAVADNLTVNHGSAEEILAARPDLVLAGAYTTFNTRRLLQAAGVPVMVLEPVTDWEGIRRQTREVAQRLGVPQRGELLLAGMEADLQALARQRPAEPFRVLGWGGGSGIDIPGTGTLFDTLLRAAGGVNVGAAVAGRASFDLEQLLQLAPEVLLQGAAYDLQPSRRAESAQHRVLRRRYAGARLDYPEAVFGCGVPSASREALRLQERLIAWRARRRPEAP
ncbi:MAG: hypothetical protein RL026_1249 [Pseudomonadota bacterium]|jgi:iron complex transport system substrate-binding protein